MDMLFNSDGVTKLVSPSNGTDYSLEELQGFVGGYIEIVRLGANKVMVINEEGKLHNLPLNIKATGIIQQYGRNDVIVGNALVCSTDKIK